VATEVLITGTNPAPDGRAFSYVGVPDHNWEVEQVLFKSSLDGSRQLQLTPFDTEVGIKHDWAPDASRIVFTGNADFVHQGESANIGTIRPDGTGTRYLTHFTGGEVNGFVGGYSPSGRDIVFRYEDHGMYALKTISTHGTHLRTVLPLSSLRPRAIDWGSR
jgi:Tol biopolymer transport system component